MRSCSGFQVLSSGPGSGSGLGSGSVWYVDVCDSAGNVRSPLCNVSPVKSGTLSGVRRLLRLTESFFCRTMEVVKRPSGKCRQSFRVGPRSLVVVQDQPLVFTRCVCSAEG